MISRNQECATPCAAGFETAMTLLVRTDTAAKYASDIPALLWRSGGLTQRSRFPVRCCCSAFRCSLVALRADGCEVVVVRGRAIDNSFPSAVVCAVPLVALETPIGGLAAVLLTERVEVFGEPVARISSGGPVCWEVHPPSPSTAMHSLCVSRVRSAQKAFWAWGTAPGERTRTRVAVLPHSLHASFRSQFTASTVRNCPASERAPRRSGCTRRWPA
jgi:hypothetical protein